MCHIVTVRAVSATRYIGYLYLPTHYTVISTFHGSIMRAIRCTWLLAYLSVSHHSIAHFNCSFIIHHQLLLQLLINIDLDKLSGNELHNIILLIVANLLHPKHIVLHEYSKTAVTSHCLSYMCLYDILTLNDKTVAKRLDVRQRLLQECITNVFILVIVNNTF